MKAERNTIQKELVAQAVHSLKNHPSAQEIYSEVARRHPNISKGTVYRNLNLLCDGGQVRRVALPGAADRFDFNCGGHYHIECKHCGRVFDMDMDYIRDMDRRIKNTHGFSIQEHDILFKGICADCVKKAEQKRT